jgi:hypothetical protein
VPPTGAAEWLTLLQDSPLVGLWLLDIFDLVNYALVGLIFIALYGALHRIRNSMMMIATVLCFITIAVFFASNQALPMLALGYFPALVFAPSRTKYGAGGANVVSLGRSSRQRSDDHRQSR